MKTQYPDVQTLCQEVQRLDALKEDFVVSNSRLEMRNDEYLTVADHTYPINSIAHGQIATKLEIPKSYYDRMGAITGLRSHNVNEWLRKEPGKAHLVRTLDGTARAFLSDRYMPLDNILILGAALPVLAENPDIQIKSASITDARLYLQASFPRIAGEIRVGDMVEFGFTLTTSEVGLGKVDVQEWFHQLKCSNGYVGESIFSRRHIGRRIGEDEEDYRIFSDKTIRAELKSFQLKLRDILKASLNYEAFKERIQAFRRAAGDSVPHSEAETVVQNVTKHYSFTEDEFKSIFNRVMQDTQISRLSIADSITFQVHETKSQDRAYDLEKAGYTLVTLPSTEWKRLSAA